MSGVVSYPEAVRIILEKANHLADGATFQTETVAIEQCLGRVLAEEIRSDRDQPPFARSTRDGFACRAADLAHSEWVRVVGQVRAGQRWDGFVEAGEAVEIMTGAPVPPGADCVVMVEHTESAGDRVRLAPGADASSVGANIVPAGAEAHRGEAVLLRGTRLAAASAGLAASLGVAEVQVFQRPKVAILATGDELVEVSDTPLPHQIRNSNSYALSALVAAAGGEPIRFPPVPDDGALLEEAIGSALEADLVLVSGGVSMGKYDLVEEVLLRLGGEFFFTGVRIQPGKPAVFGWFRRLDPPKYVFGLPGNPVSALVTFQLFVEPLLGALCGREPALPPFRQARLKTRVTVKPGLTRFLPAMVESVLSEAGITVEVDPVAWHGSGDLTGAGRANGYLVVPPDRGELAAGETVVVLTR